MSDTIILPSENEKDPTFPQDQSPLLTIQLPDQQKIENDGESDTNLDKNLQRLDCLLTLLGFNHSSVLRLGISWTVFLLIGVALPVVVLELLNCPGCDKFQIKSFELDIIASQACLAAVSLFCVSHNLRKYGIRKFLFVDRFSGQMERFSEYYIQKILDSIRLLILWILPCFILKLAREIIRSVHVHQESGLQSFAILMAFILSWSYVTVIFLSACILFHLVCYLQIIHFDDYGNLLNGDSEVLLLIEEHTRLRYHLSKISHRFRIFLLLAFLVVTTSQFVTLFQTTGYSGIITFINCGDFAVSSVVQVVGITLCLNAAAKISHRAQGIASIASRWHALAACSSTDSPHLRFSNSSGNMRHADSVELNYSESDLESLDHMTVPMTVPMNTQVPSHTLSYHKRQAFVLYLQNNPGGITIYGWTVDRALINTIFFIQLSLVLFVLGKTIVFTSE